MLIYNITKKSSDRIAILHFGLGLVGKAINASIIKHSSVHRCIITKQSFSWNDFEKSTIELDAISRNINVNTSEVYIIWSAGKCGFSATIKEVTIEKKHFELIIPILSKQLKTLNILKSHFILTSSAGGLFEKQTHINQNSLPKPLRPYGELKLAQEKFIQSNQFFNKIKILRLSSVYSNYIAHDRMGLIAVLMNNGIKHKVSTIFGSENTLRDYVLDQDIGNYIANLVLINLTSNTINFLISGKPSSILEIKKNIEFIIHKQLYLNYTFAKSNAANICFERTLCPTGFNSSPLFLNLKILYLNILSNKNIYT